MGEGKKKSVVHCSWRTDAAPLAEAHRLLLALPLPGSLLPCALPCLESFQLKELLLNGVLG